MRALAAALLALLAPACAALATPPGELPCLVACMRELRPTSMSIARPLPAGGTECRCWAPLLPGEAARPATARIVLP